MNPLQALILGIVQGLGEFLPVSSSGHLVLLQKIFGVGEGAMSFDIIVHLGTLISLCAVMKDRLLRYLREPFGHIPRMVLAGTVPTVAIVLIFSRFFEKMFDTGVCLGFGFLFTAAVLYIAENHKTPGGDAAHGNAPEPGQARRRSDTEKSVTLKGALITGIAQGIAVTPAVSRSGATITAGIICDFGRRAAVEFAFLMSIPVTLLAVAQDLLKIILNKAGSASGAAAVNGAAANAVNGAAVYAAGPLEMLIGFAASAVTGYFAARFMLNIIQRIRLTWFSLYVGLLGTLVLLDQLFFGLVFDKFF